MLLVSYDDTHGDYAEAPEAAMFGIDDITRTVVVDHLLSLNDFCTAERTLGYSYASRAIINTFALLLDLALNDSILFERLVQARRFHTQIGRFLLLDPRTTCRKHVEMCITGICQVQSRSVSLPPGNH